MNIKALVIVCSYHHHNTEKVARAMGKALNAEVKTPQQVTPDELAGCDLVGFGSGIYSDQHHKRLLALAENLPPVTGTRAFLFSTSGAPAFAFKGGYLADYTAQAHALLRHKLECKGYTIVGDFMCPGHNTNSFLKLFGGFNKSRPDAQDLEQARAFVLGLGQGDKHEH